MVGRRQREAEEKEEKERQTMMRIQGVWERRASTLLPNSIIGPLLAVHSSSRLHDRDITKPGLLQNFLGS